MFNNKGSILKKGPISIDKRYDVDNNSGSLERLNEKLVNFMLSSNESHQQLEFKLRDLELQLRNQLMENESLKTEIHALNTKNVVLSQKVSDYLLLGSKFESMCYDNKMLFNEISKLKEIVMESQSKGNNDIVDHVDRVQQALFCEIKQMTESIEAAYDHRCRNLERLIRKISMKEAFINPKRNSNIESCGISSRRLDNAIESDEYSDDDISNSSKNKEQQNAHISNASNKPTDFKSPENKTSGFRPKGDNLENKECTSNLNMNTTSNANTISTSIPTTSLFENSNVKHNFSRNSNTEMKNSFFSINKPIFGESSNVFGTKSSLFGNNKTEMLFSTKSVDIDSQPNSSSLFSKPLLKETVKNKESVEKFTLNNQSKETDSLPMFGSGSNIPSFSSLSLNVDKGFGSATETKWAGGSKLFSNQPKEECESVKEDEFNEHDPEFKPIIELPPLIEITRDDDQKTILFKNRCKLYRFANSEWKERGVGDMKILKSNIDNSVTLVMRREQIHKLCCNQRVTRDSPNLTPMGNDKSSCWVAADFSEGESSMEKFAVKFSDKTIMDEFSRILNNVKSSL